MAIVNTTELELFVFLLLSSLLLSALAVLVHRYRTIRGTRWFTVLLAVTAVWAFGAAVKLAAPPRIEYVFVILELPMGVLFAFVFFAFASSYTGRTVHRSRPFAWVVTAVFGGMFGLMVTNHVHGLLWDDIGSSTTVFPHLVHVDTGPVYFGLIVAAYLLYAVGVYYLIDIQLRSRYDTSSLLLITLGALSPLLVNVVSILGPASLPNIDYTPFGLVVLGLATTQSIQRNFLDIVPIARDTAVEYSTEGIVILDSRRCIRDYNPTADDLLHGLDEHVGDPFETVFDGDLSLDRESETRTERQVRNGVDRRVSVTTAPIRDGTYHLGWTVVISDVTDRRRRERHLDLVGRVLRHNMSNRMTTILGLTEVLESHVDEEGRDYLATVGENVERIIDTSATLREIQDIVTDERGRAAIEVTNPVEKVTETVAVTYPEASVTMRGPDDLWAYCATGLRPAVENLIENGIEHNDSDEPSVEVRLTTDEETVHIAVVDNGSGISDDERRIIDEGETPLQHSSGVGLWLVYCFVEHSGGELAFDRTENGGSEITLTLDAAPPRDD